MAIDRSWLAALVTDSDEPLRLPPLPAAPGPERICASCEIRWQPVDRARRVYCGRQCSGVADAVRYGRKKQALWGDLVPDDIAEAIDRKVSHAVSGGYRRPRVPAKVRRAVWARNDGLCDVGCGRPGAEVHHFNGDSNDPSDLQHLCSGCHSAETQRHVGPIPDDRPDVQAHAVEIGRRMKAAAPERPCDDPDGWDPVAWCSGPGLA